MCTLEAWSTPGRIDPWMILQRPWKGTQGSFKQGILGFQVPRESLWGEWFTGGAFSAPQISHPMGMVIAEGDPGQRSILPTSKHGIVGGPEPNPLCHPSCETGLNV